MAKILVTGATGFVGRRLVFSLLEQGHEVYALCRIYGTLVFSDLHLNLTHLWGDLRDPKTLESLPQDLDVAYYLVHSMTEIVSDLSHIELEVAKGFVDSLKKTNVKQIIYLGGIINDPQQLSSHLKSRLLVEKVLQESLIPTTILRASIIVGSGSASFEIIRDLCEKLPFMIAPKWLNSPCQPIAIQDILFYLKGVLLKKECENKIFDVGGEEVLTFKELLIQYAEFRHLKRIIVDVPVLTPRLSSLWLVLITSVKFSLCFYLVESIKTSSVARLNGIQKILPHHCLTFKEALDLAFQKIAQNEVVSTWMDAWEIEGSHANIDEYIQVPKSGCLKDLQKIVIKDSKEATIERIWQLGGAKGYYALNWSWKLRGVIDQLMGGVGLNRGRRHPSKIEIGDSIDFWRVLKADKQQGELILYAVMKLPGEAWLEFRLKSEGDQWILIQEATFRPKGVLGRVYWYALFPFHFLIFRKMGKALAGQS